MLAGLLMVFGLSTATGPAPADAARPSALRRPVFAGMPSECATDASEDDRPRPAGSEADAAATSGEEEPLRVKRVVVKAKPNKRGLVVPIGVVFVVDGEGYAVADAEIVGRFAGAVDDRVTATTNVAGRAALRSRVRPDPEAPFTFCIESIEKPGFRWDPEPDAPEACPRDATAGEGPAPS